MATSKRVRLIAPLLGCLAVLGASTIAARQEPPGENSPAARMVTRANALVAALDDARALLARAEHDVAERTQWAFGPVQREGLPLGGLDDAQMEALEGLLDTALSDDGMHAWRQVRALETELRRRESTPESVATHRDPDLYWLRVYGTPDVKQRWSWRFEGHHLALHVDCKPNKTPSVTPFFLGASPLFLENDAGEETLGVAHFGALNRTLEELDSMLGATVGRTESEKPGDIRMGPGRDALPPAEGVALGKLRPTTRVKLLSLLDGYLALLEPELRVPYTIDPERASKVHFVRWGPSDIHEPRAWSILAPRFALELATTTGPDHIHIVLRDPERDFGGK